VFHVFAPLKINNLTYQQSSPHGSDLRVSAHGLKAYGTLMAAQYTPSHFALNIDLDFEGSLMDVDASGHRCIKELAVRGRANWGLAQHVGKPASRLTVARRR
jgi:hypothetical protein